MCVDVHVHLHITTYMYHQICFFYVHACVYYMYVGVYESFLEAFHVYHTVNVHVMLSAYQAIYTILVSLDSVFCILDSALCTCMYMYSNTDKERSSCSAPEEQWSDDVGDSQEYVESPFIPGSLVWAKMDKYPWYTDTP